jgi:hypothetical protein
LKRQTLQAAFKKTLLDRKFQTQSKGTNVENRPIAGAEPAPWAREVMAQSAEVIERMEQLLEK